MQPIRELLARIRWDPDFGDAVFELGYWDRTLESIVRVRVGDVRLWHGNHFSFRLEDECGEPLELPMHRVREVWRDGVRIWERRGAPGKVA